MFTPFNTSYNYVANTNVVALSRTQNCIFADPSSFNLDIKNTPVKVLAHSLSTESPPGSQVSLCIT